MAMVAGLLPHGIFEVSALLTAGSYGLWFGWQLTLRTKNKTIFILATKRHLGLFIFMRCPS
jgi:uncharacterized membrane protein SpoIIM required for sporulation